MPDPLRTVYCTLYSLNVYLGKALNPNCGLDRSWLGKSAVLIKDHQTGEKRTEGEKTQSCSIPGWGGRRGVQSWEGGCRERIPGLGLTTCCHYTVIRCASEGFIDMGLTTSREGEAAARRPLPTFIMARGSSPEIGVTCRARPGLAGERAVSKE